MTFIDICIENVYEQSLKLDKCKKKRWLPNTKSQDDMANEY